MLSLDSPPLKQRIFSKLWYAAPMDGIHRSVLEGDIERIFATSVSSHRDWVRDLRNSVKQVDSRPKKKRQHCVLDVDTIMVYDGRRVESCTIPTKQKLDLASRRTIGLDTWKWSNRCVVSLENKISYA